MDGVKFDVNHAKVVALRHNADLVVVHKKTRDFMGHKCTCGYFLDEGDYQTKGRELDYRCYVCESCGYLLVVYENRLPVGLELNDIIRY